MIKRRFYKDEHADRNGDSDSSSSSSSDSDSPVEEEEEEEEEVDKAAAAEGSLKEDGIPGSYSSGSGYESEDSSGNEINCGSSVNDDEDTTGRERQNLKDSQLASKDHVVGIDEIPSKDAPKAFKPKDSIQDEEADVILKCKSVFKCRLCPRIVCLSEETLIQHLKSKRHARSKKLLGEGRLKLMLNSDGEIEEDQETHAERHARTVALAQDVDALKRKNKGRQRQRMRRQKKLQNGCDKGKAGQLTENSSKKRRKIKD